MSSAGETIMEQLNHGGLASNPIISPELTGPSQFSGVGRPDVLPTTLRNAIKSAAACLAVVALLVMSLLANSAAVSSDCRSNPIPLVFDANIQASIMVASGIACPVWAQPLSATVDELQITTPPQNGQALLRGRTGMIYRPNAGFKGEDFVAFAMQGRSHADHGRAIVRVRVTVR
jgi:hypothetical protein